MTTGKNDALIVFLMCMLLGGWPILFLVLTSSVEPSGGLFAIVEVVIGVVLIQRIVVKRRKS